MQRTYQRPRQEEWDRRNLKTISTHLTRQEATRLKALCAAAGISPYRLLRRFLLKVIYSQKS